MDYLFYNFYSHSIEVLIAFFVCFFIGLTLRYQYKKLGRKITIVLCVLSFLLILLFIVNKIVSGHCFSGLSCSLSPFSVLAAIYAFQKGFFNASNYWDSLDSPELLADNSSLKSHLIENKGE